MLVQRRRNVRWVIAEKDGAKNFFMLVFEIEPGGYTPLHHHSWEHEMFVCGGKGSVVKPGGKRFPLRKDQWFSFRQMKNSRLKIRLRKLLRLFALYPRALIIFLSSLKPPSAGRCTFSPLNHEGLLG